MNSNNNILTENYINIDSDDRKIGSYPDAFDYVVTFKSTGRSFYKGFKEGVPEELPETAGPMILRSFTNVKYIRLDNIIMSRYNINSYNIEHFIDFDSDNNISIMRPDLEKNCHKDSTTEKKDGQCDGWCDCNCPKCNNNHKCVKCFSKNNAKKCKCSQNICAICCKNNCSCAIVHKYKFLMLRIKELSNNNFYSTSLSIPDDAFILLQDKTLGNNHNTWVTRSGTCTFPGSNLYNLNRLSIKICDNKGNELKMCVIIHYKIVINKVLHQITITFGTLDRAIKDNLHPNQINFPLSEICNIKSWYRTVCNNVFSHTNSKIRHVLESNYESLFDSISTLDFEYLIKSDITNNIFIVVGTLGPG